MYTAKTDAAKIASKRVIQMAAEGIGKLIGNKLADKITSVGKLKNKGKDDETQEIPHENISKSLMI